MEQVLEVIYRNGAFMPLKPLGLPENQRLKITLHLPAEKPRRRYLGCMAAGLCWTIGNRRDRGRGHRVRFASTSCRNETNRATALTHDLTLVTENTGHFERITGLRLESWRLPSG